MAERGWCPFAIQLRLTTDEEMPDNPDIEKVSICNHIADGTDSRDWLQNADNNSSVHFLIRIERGKAIIYQFISIFRTAWGNGRHSGVSNPFMPEWVKEMIRNHQGINYATISVEHEGRYPKDLPYREVMIQASINLQKWICSEIPTIRKDRAHIIGHYQIDHVNRAFCPGGPAGVQFPFNRVVTELNMVASYTPQGAQHAITVSEFISFYRAEPKALQYFGLPISATEQAVLSDGKTYTVQYFERARFELHGTMVLLGLLGVEIRS